MDGVLDSFFASLAETPPGRLPTTPTGVLRFDFDGHDTWFVALADGRARAYRDGTDADCRVEMSRASFERLLAGRDHFVSMLFRGVLSVGGDLALMHLFRRLLPVAANSVAVEPATPGTTFAEPGLVGLQQATRIFAGSLFMISEANGNVGTSPTTPMGLYFFDTRFLSTWDLTLDGEQLSVLSHDAVNTWESRFGLVPGEPTHYVSATTSVMRRRQVDKEFQEEITLLNHAPAPVRYTMRLAVAADFAEVPEVRSGLRRDRPVVALVEQDTLRLHYKRESLHRETVVTASEPARIDEDGLTFTVTVDAKSAWSTRLRVLTLVRDLHSRDLRERLNSSTGRSDRRVPTDIARLTASAPRLRADYEPLQHAYERSVRDLAALHYPGLNYLDGLPATGLPWSMTLLVRESLISSFQALPFLPERAARTLRILALTQGARDDPFRGEQPGKIVQECRYGDSAAFNDTPESANFTAVDTTALFVILLDEYERWTGDADLVRGYEYEVRAAIAWLDGPADPQRTGYVWAGCQTSRTEEVGGTWRSSAHAICFADGRPAGFPQATCEVQGYTYDAKRRAARMARLFWQDLEWADRLEREAAELQDRFDRDFWLPDRGHYAVALSADGRPVDGLASNMGHLLWSDMVPMSRRDDVVRHLFGPGLWSGWGIRTVAEDEPGYNPLGRHTGAVWPWDNSMIAWGLCRAGFRAEAARIAEGMLEASRYFDGRLPAYLTGYDRAATKVPVPYGLADSPYAPSSGTPLMVLRTLLGLEPYANHLAVEAGVPEEMGQIELLDIPGRWGYTDALGRGRPFRARRTP
ncbi:MULTISPECIES: glycogen debranching N-terminal domain-containing protein [unclassified Micromonospora]|uniref:glycogen debranching N-terminal domain-containing protein n=1 Tax=unclassified Micromonospora TaxID=2617518 RepID=UPI001376378C|nr:glycogen debranching N-terminal domain-containing protein [Verrucosispora sp. SN26_14.1]